MWFDRGKFLSAIKNLLSGNKISSQTIEEACQKRIITHKEIESSFEKCPACFNKMEVFNYCYNSNVLLLRCGHCGGIWADRNKLEAAAKYHKGNPEIKKFAEALGSSLNESHKIKEASMVLNELASIVTPGRMFAYWPLAPILLKNDASAKSFAKATIGIIVINVLFFIFQVVFIRGSKVLYFNTLGIVPSLGFSVSRLYSFLASMFVHVGVVHIFINMYYLWIFGNKVENKIGHTRFVAFYLLSGIAGSVVFCLLNYNSRNPVVGASGAIAGVLAGYLVLFPGSPIEVLWLGAKRVIPAIFFLLFWIVYQLFYGVAVLAGGKFSVAYWSHIGGFVTGLIKVLGFVKTTF